MKNYERDSSEGDTALYSRLAEATCFRPFPPSLQPAKSLSLSAIIAAVWSRRFPSANKIGIWSRETNEPRIALGQIGKSR
jgi:hypothetical protein